MEDNLNLLNKDNKGSVTFLISNPRSLSTVFCRILKNYPNTHLIIGKFCHIHVEEKNVKKSDKSYEELAKTIEDEIDSELLKGKNVIVKDIGYYIFNYFLNVFEYYIKKYNPKIVYLIRHPVPTHLSFQKMMDKEKLIGNLPLDFIRFDEKNEKYEGLWNLYQLYKGYVTIVEDVQREPDKTLSYVFNYLKWGWDSKYLQFKSISDEEMKLLNDFNHWYQECINSTEFKKSEPKVDYEFTEDWIKDKISRSMIFYNKFVDASSDLSLNEK